MVRGVLVWGRGGRCFRVTILCAVDVISQAAEGIEMLKRYRGRLLLAAALVAVVVLTTLANQLMFGPADADSPGDGGHAATEVRINAKRLADGRVEFALQQHDGGAWGERIEPRSRFFPANAQVDAWLNSSPIELEVELPVAAAGPMSKLCVVADGDPDTLFWQLLELHTKRAADLIGLDLDYSSHPDVGDRVEAISECVEHGAQMILATLADADDIIPALHEAAAAGVKIATFGAGEDHADRAGSLIHVSFDETAAARRAAQQFQSLGVTGTVVCVGRAGDPQGRNGICDVVGGLIEDVDVVGHELDASDWSGQISSILEDNADAAGLLVTEADLLPAAIEAMHDSGVSAVLGSIGEYPLSQLSFEQRDQIAFTVMDLARVEALLPMAALHYMYTFHPNARFFEGAMIFEGVPNVHTGGAKGGHGRPDSTDDHSHDDEEHGDDDHDDSDDNGHGHDGDDDHDDGDDH